MTYRYVAAAAILLVVAAAVLSAQQQPAPPRPEEPTVITAGEAIVNAVPDRAWISIAAESRAGNPRDAQKKNTEAMTPVLDKLRAAGVPAEAIRTVGYDLQQEFDYINNRRVSKGYVARNTVEVRVDNVERVGELLEIAIGSGATSVGGLRFDLKDRAKLEREAIRQATADARGRAEAAAEGAGRAIDQVKKIEVHNAGGGYIGRVAMARESLQANAAPAAPPEISAGQMEIRAQVTLTASLK